MQAFEKVKSKLLMLIHKLKKKAEPRKKYYNSIEWGIYEPGDEDRHKGLDYLDEIGCRAITRTEARNIDRCYYSNFDTVSEFPKTFSLMNHYREIANRCSIKPGYYEFVYGESDGEDDLFFTFHSNNEKFQGPLTARIENVDTYDEIKSRICQRIYGENYL